MHPDTTGGRRGAALRTLARRAILGTPATARGRRWRPVEADPDRDDEDYYLPPIPGRVTQWRLNRVLQDERESCLIIGRVLRTRFTALCHCATVIQNMSAGIKPTIELTDEGDQWVARDIETGVASHGPTREAALENLDDALALRRGKTGDQVRTASEEADVLEELGIDSDEVADALAENDELPDCLK